MKVYQVDAFTAEPFAGNPAAVVPLEQPAAESWMQAVAAEMNLSETAFVHPEGDRFRLRWFTPVVEVELCGHATLATSHVLWSEGLCEAEVIHYATRSGELLARAEGELIELDFPSRPPTAIDAPAGLAEALGAGLRWVGTSTEDLLVELESDEVVRSLKPDTGALLRVTARGIIVTAASADERFDFVSRFFAPAVGVPEDPVTGSAHCVLGPFWSGRLGRHNVVGYQASTRSGVVRVRVRGERVAISGRAVTVMRGDLLA
ncbi:MAG: PhzF family phenazine biosynthesis protein [Acidobacteria bacterium]|jgi:PhzF family phenazine biosynthesis protein|nr:PhzF family phenazine biosynthesis protein [Acidobacteriota bacterium]